MYEDCACLFDHFVQYGFTLLRCAAAEVYLCSVTFRCCDLGRSGDCGHDDVGGDTVCASCERQCLSMIAWRITSYLAGMLLIRSIGVDVHTRAMCYHPLCQFFFVQSRQRMESTPYLECANALVVLTFEEEVDFRPCGCLSFEWSANQGLWRLGCRCKL